MTERNLAVLCPYGYSERRFTGAETEYKLSMYERYGYNYEKFY